LQLQQFFSQNPRIAVAFSGGVDSSYLLHAAKNAACDVHAYFLKAEFQPQFELCEARHIAEHIGVRFTVDEFSVIGEAVVAKNPADRCYHCKLKIFERLWALARSDGYSVLCDGTNADDDESDRPGMKALRELGVLSPLRICGLTKAEIRRLSEQAGLSTHDKPAYACLATRIPTGTLITQEYLDMVERAESALFDLGFSDFRVRIIPPDTAKIQMPEAMWDEAATRRIEILAVIGAIFKNVVLDFVSR